MKSLEQPGTVVRLGGIGLEGWASPFYAQKGLDPDKWPEAFRKIVGELPEGIRFL